MNNYQKEKERIVSNIFKNVNKKEWDCLHPQCKNKTINSHMLQKNGIISNISENNHVIEIKANEDKNEKSSITFTRVGVNKTISLPLFCNIHDTSIFKKIETRNVCYEDYETQILFCYRAVCGELRKKEKVAEAYSRILNSKTLQPTLDYDKLKILLTGYKRGIADLLHYKASFEKHLTNLNLNEFCFFTYKYAKIDICASVVFSLLSNNPALHESNFSKPWNAIFVNLIPQENELIIIIGYNINNADTVIKEYTDRWANLSQEQLELKITDLIATKVESWCMSPSVFVKISKEKLDSFKKIWDENLMNFRTANEKTLNIFR